MASSRFEVKAEEQCIEEKVVKADGEVLMRKYKKGKFLGKGGFARCYEFNPVDSRKAFAAKVVPKVSLTKTRAKQKLMSEIKIHRSLRHPNIVNFEHFFEDIDNVYILLELCPNQTLSELLRRRKRLTELEVQCYAMQLLRVLKHLRGFNVIHRDLKLSNLFLSEKLELKVGDFGLAARLETPEEKRRTICGTPNYIAPEVLDGKQGHSFGVDIWSFGVILYTMLIGKPPFETSDVKTTYRRIRMNAYSFPEHVHISAPAKDLITKILVVDPNQRLSLDAIGNHLFFNQGHQIPALLPTSTLACPPSATYLKQFLTPATERTKVKERSIRLTSQTERGKGVTQSKLEATGTWVTKWVDYSTKYGLGYLLSNGASGVYFNDATKILLMPDSGEFKYFERQKGETEETGMTYNLDEYPKEIHKKVTLLQHFRNYLGTVEGTPTQGGEAYVKKWMRTRHAILFRLSNKVVQVNFQDRTELVLCSATKELNYLNKAGVRVVYPLATAMDSSDQEMTKRLKYTKDILTHMLNNPKPNNNN